MSAPEPGNNGSNTHDAGLGKASGAGSAPASAGKALGSPAAGVRIGTSSRERFRAYLERRKRGVQAQTVPGATEGADEDPNSPKKLKRTRTFRTLLGAFWGMLRGRRVLVGACVMTVMVSALVGLAAPASTKIALDYVLTDHPGPSGLPAWVPTRDRGELLWLLAGALMALTVTSLSLGVWGRWQMTRLTQRTRAAVRRRVFNHAVRLPLHRVYQLKSGGAASILREDAGQAADLLFSVLYNPFRAVVQLVGTLIILAYTDWRLLTGAVLLIPAAWFSQKTWIARIRPVFREVRATRQHIDAHATEAFGGMRIVRAFARSRGEAARFIRNNHLLSRQEILAWWWSRTIEIVWQILLPLGSMAVLIYGGSRVIHGTLTMGDVMMFSAYLLMLLGPLESLSASATSIQAELASFDRVLDLLDEPLEFTDAQTAAAAGAGARAFMGTGQRSGLATGVGVGPSSEFGRTAPNVSGRITFVDVGFHYPGAAQNVLTGIDLDVPAGATVALVGPSGAGKTTLCNLVARFYDPTHGRIELDGTDIRTLRVDDYRKLLGVVEQDVFLFDGTVRENIGYARRGASIEQIKDAARSASADGFIEKLEHGYDTLVGERGVRLSGGQKQRLAIARALLADPRILILDEATSNLDSESEALIQESLRKLMRGRTCFVIAHRLSTIRSADVILVIDHGRIIERGTHDELVAREGRYWEMLKRQLEPTSGAADASKVAGSPARR